MIRIAFCLCALLLAQTTFAQSAPELKLEKADHPVVKMTTDRGEIWLELFPEDAPKHVARFTELIQKGHYNGLSFHRVEPGFVIQGGDPTGTGSGGTGQKLPLEIGAHKHVKGTLAMARAADPNSADCQFYIVTGNASFLDGSYTVFGQVVAGHDVPEKIQRGDKMTKVEMAGK